jgi:hypothetical protein
MTGSDHHLPYFGLVAVRRAKTAPFWPIVAFVGLENFCCSPDSNKCVQMQNCRTTSAQTTPTNPKSCYIYRCNTIIELFLELPWKPENKPKPRMPKW